MYTLDETYADMENRGIIAVYCTMQANCCLSLQNGRLVGVDHGKCSTQAEERTAIIHEDGHFESGSFYLPFSEYQVKEQAEYKADKTAIFKYVPYKTLCALLQAGYTLNDIAEHFNLTESYILKAYLLYKDLGYSFGN